MARVFLDTNVVIDFIEERREVNPDLLENDLFVSPLSFHILIYTYKYKIPNETLTKSRKYFNIVPLKEDISDSALLGPTNDFEDNIQLHSAAEAECDFFLTNDKKLLALKFFGKTKIAQDFPKF